KYYHGDLMERSMCLLLALTGNWGKPGTGITGLALAGLDGYFLFPMKTRRGVEETTRILEGIDGAIASIREQDVDASDEMIGNQLLAMSVVSGTSTSCLPLARPRCAGPGGGGPACSRRSGRSSSWSSRSTSGSRPPRCTQTS